MHQHYHVPVLFEETMQYLDIKTNGVYVDCTFGGGGHSRGILARIGANGKLVAFDQDADATNNLPDDNRLLFVRENFRHIGRFLRLNNVPVVDGILADLGVSSHQFDEGGRGFSTRYDGPLDMRMDQRQDFTAAEVLMTKNEQQLHKMFEWYGEVTNSKTLARHIVVNRAKGPLKTISDLKNLLHPMVKGNPAKYLAQVFQALRIEVNDEMGALKEMLEQAPLLLKPGGRVAIITFHSIEDRIVKEFFRNGTFDQVQEHPLLSVERNNQLKLVTKKPVTPTDDELKNNPRSRSAKLRVAEKK